MHESRHFARVLIVDADGHLILRADLSGPGAPDLLAVDAVAQLALSARHAQATIRVTDVAEDLSVLLELAALPVEVERQAEAREQALGVEQGQEEVHGGDPAP